MTPEERKEIGAALARAYAENWALQVLCATLMAEIASLTNDPKGKLGAMVAQLRTYASKSTMMHKSAQLQGAAMTLAPEAQQQINPSNDDVAQTVTAVVERVCSIAETIV